MRALQSISISKHAEAEQTDRMISCGSGRRPLPRHATPRHATPRGGSADATSERARKYELMK